MAAQSVLKEVFTNVALFKGILPFALSKILFRGEDLGNDFYIICNKTEINK